MSGLHESRESLSAELLDRHRAIESLREELEAVDWYDQRIEAAADEDLRRVLEHNRDEELEHASMLIEWLRRQSEVFDTNLGTYLNTTGPIVEVEEGVGGPPSLGIGGGEG